MKNDEISSVEALRQLYDSPMKLAVKKQKCELDRYSRQFLELSAFSILATSDSNGNMDCSPRGDYPGFIQILDDEIIAIPDRPGNNRLDSLNNIIENSNVGLLLLVPGFKECLRINGKAVISINDDLIRRAEYKGKLPKSIIVISIREIYFHCAKAITRAKLWESEFHVDRSVMPRLGKILMEQVNPSSSEEDIKKVEDLIEERAKTTLY